MSDAAITNRITNLLAELSNHDIRELKSRLAGPFGQSMQNFLRGLDTNDKGRLEAVILAAYEQYVTELPGPNEFMKAKLRPAVESFAKNFVADWCGEGD